MNDRLRREGLYFVLLLVPVVFTTFWMLSNTQFPASDATDYLLSAFKTWHHLTDRGIWHGIVHLNVERGWRPLLFSTLSVPFLLLSHGNVMFAFQSVAVLTVLASTVYAYLLLRLELGRLSAGIAANLVCLLPFIQTPVFVFNSESVLFPSIMGSLYHLIQSDYLRNKIPTRGFILCLTLAIVLRPIEAVTDLFFVMVAFLLSGRHKGIFTSRQIIAFLALSLGTLFLFLFLVDMQLLHHFSLKYHDDPKVAAVLYKLSFLVLASFLFVGSILSRLKVDANLNRPPIPLIFGTIFLLAFMWYAPYAYQTFYWVYQCSVGELAVVTGQSMTHQPFLTTMVSFVRKESAVVVLGLVLLALLNLSLMKKKQLGETLLSTPVIYFILLAPFPFWEVLNTCQTEPRKLGVAFSGLLMVLLIMGLRQDRWWRFRIFVAGLLLAAQFLYALTVIYPATSQSGKLANLLGSYPRPITMRPNAHDVVIAFLDRMKKNYGFKNIAIEVSWKTGLPVYPYLLSMLSRMANNPYDVSYLFFSTYTDDISLQMHDSVDAVFLTDKQSNMVISAQAAQSYYTKYVNEINPAMKNLYHFLHYYAQGKLNEIGWEPGPCLNMRGSDNTAYLGCLLVPFTRP